MTVNRTTYPKIDMAKAEALMAEYNKAYPMDAEPTLTTLLDIHTVVAALMYRCQYSEVTKEQRRNAKSINFRLMYTPEAKLSMPSREHLFSIYSPSEIKQLQVDLKWDGTEDLYDTIRRYVGVK